MRQNNLCSTFCFVMKDEDGDTKSVSEMLVEKLPIFVQSADLEVQERVSDSCQTYPSTHATKSDCNFVFVCKCPPMQVSEEAIKIHTTTGNSTQT